MTKLEEREREKVSRRGVGGDTEHYVVHPHVGNVIFFFFSFFFLPLYEQLLHWILRVRGPATL